MFGMGMNEILIIAVIAVIIIGPRQIPELARTMGKMMAQFKRATNELRTAVNEEISQQIETEELKEIRQSLDADLHTIESQARSYVESEFDDERALMDDVEEDFQTAAKGVKDGMDHAVAEAEAELDAKKGGKTAKKKTVASAAGKKKITASKAKKSTARKPATSTAKKTTASAGQKSAPGAARKPAASKGKTATAPKKKAVAKSKKSSGSGAA